MQKRKIGRSGLEVSALGFGCMSRQGSDTNLKIRGSKGTERFSAELCGAFAEAFLRWAAPSPITMRYNIFGSSGENMSFIDWSDPDGLFDMLVEYVSDEKNSAHGDAHREQFLGRLLSKLKEAQAYTEDLPEVMGRLKGLIGSVGPEFREDSVMDHLTACLEELERIKKESAGRRMDGESQ